VAVKRPIGIYEWAALTQEMLEKVYPREVFPHDEGWVYQINTALEFFLSLRSDAVERGEKLLEESE
jgi:hypothetical protein